MGLIHPLLPSSPPPSAAAPGSNPGLVPPFRGSQTEQLTVPGSGFPPEVGTSGAVSASALRAGTVSVSFTVLVLGVQARKWLTGAPETWQLKDGLIERSHGEKWTESSH